MVELLSPSTLRSKNFRDKLRREWKTAALAVATFLVGVWDAGASAMDWTPVVPPQYRQYVPLFLGVLFLVLRKWIDAEKLAEKPTEK